LAEVDLLPSGAGSGLDGRVEQVGGRRLRCRAGRHDGIGENRQHRALSLFVLAHQVYLQVGAVTVEDVLAGRVQMPLHQPVAIIADRSVPPPSDGWGTSTAWPVFFTTRRVRA